jgi:hypothetical protein
LSSARVDFVAAQVAVMAGLVPAIHAAVLRKLLALSGELPQQTENRALWQSEREHSRRRERNRVGRRHKPRHDVW